MANTNDYDLIKIKEKIMQVSYYELNNYITPFMSLPYQLEIERMLKHLDLDYCYFNNGERKTMIIGDISEKETSNPIVLLEIKCFEELHHNEILGAILNIGIKREVVGNIYINDGEYLIEVFDKMKKFIIDNFTYVSHHKIKVEETNKKIPIIRHEIREVIVSSMRLDNVVSSVFNMSRECAKEFINNEEVYLNFSNELKIDQRVSFNSYLSCRKKGKVIILEEKCKTKKDNLVIKVEYF